MSESSASTDYGGCHHHPAGFKGRVRERAEEAEEMAGRSGWGRSTTGASSLSGISSTCHVAEKCESVLCEFSGEAAGEEATAIRGTAARTTATTSQIDRWRREDLTPATSL